ncbi:pentatricopeptide repeat-containing protein At3g09040, mitochondrial isoform X1 [Salvia miltiorrhiza]|uniref:pentatricopeptide repeat-containing protein At3g09040, mitochondrial isoform X1 n=1 Tax=Salvia miltiorrhiza TaxID=226208 RepID=UPI0025AB6D44|nr:pentatricopeptide repeat-containing protein At3g09040, mitochondrial isoform X1 [Salvia miltiorrhiza]
MLPRYSKIRPQRLNPKSPFSHLQSEFSTLDPVKDKIFRQSPSQELDFYAYLLEKCLGECKKIQTRQVFDRIPERLSFSLKAAKAIHAQSLKFGISSERELGNSILDLYSKCGHMDYTRKVFLHLEKRDELAWNSVMSMKSRRRLFGDVREDFASMWSCGVAGNQFTFAIVLSACAKLMDVDLGKQAHCAAMKLGFETDAYCEGALVDMYAKCGYLAFAKRIFDVAVYPDRVAWTSMISGLAQAGLISEALRVFEQMQEAGHVPDDVVLVTVLSTYVGRGRLEDACRLFAQMRDPNVVAWNVMISGHVKGGNEGGAIKLFKKMVNAGVEPTRSTLGSVLRAIATVANLTYGLQVHSWALKRGLSSNVYAGSSLVNMYAKCQRMEAAIAVFNDSEEKNEVLWNALIGGYAQNGHAREVFELFVSMKVSGFRPDEYTHTSLLSACACLGDINMGRLLHSFIIKNEFGRNLYVQNALVDMYAKCGALLNARKLFEQIKNRDNVSWNAIIVGYVQEEEQEEAFRMFRWMMSEGIAPDEVSLASILSAVANLKDLCKGMQIHCFMHKYGLEKGMYAGSSLIDMYCKCRVVDTASHVFSSMPEKNVICVNALISGYAQFSLGEASDTFKYMLLEGLQPSEVTFATLLEACSSYNDLYLGMQIHSFILKVGLPFSDEFLAVSLLGMYINNRRNSEAIGFFSELPRPRSTVLWTVLISGSAQSGCYEEALLWYHKMRCHNALPDQATFCSALKACSGLASLEEGKKIHSFIFHVGYDKDELTGSALVDMYAKCGDIESSAQVFGEMTSKKDVILWNSMIVGYGKNGYAQDALKVFEEMKGADIEPDAVTFLGVLTACSHAGMVREGREIYDSMIGLHGVKPRGDHWACMVDLYGRWGFLDEAEKFIHELGSEPGSMVWAAYLSACRLQGDDARGKRAAEKLFELEPHDSSPYVLLSSIHAASGNWDGAEFVREMMMEKGVLKLPGSSKISLDVVS